MQAFAKPRVHSWGVVLTLIVIVAGLAVVQYRWSSQVSEAARTRMQASLQLSLMDFRRDFSRELAAIALSFEPESDSITQISARSLSEKLHSWQRTALHPDLIARVYLWRSSTSEGGRLLTTAGTRPHFVQVSWPPELAALRPHLQNMDSASLTGEPRRSTTGPDPRHHDNPAWAFSASVPALIYDLNGGQRQEDGADWLIIQLNPDVLQAKVFPELARRYMADSDGMIYQVAVMGGTEDKPRAFFTSDPSFSPLAHRRVDAELNLFGPPSLPPGSAVPPRPAPAPPPPASVRAPAMGSAAAANFEPVRFFPFHDQTGSTGWWLLAQHRKGSVEAAVAQLRRRDLTLSFGVLLVLAFTMGLIVVTSQRARQLASLQMDFVAGVSHELRTPLAVISSAAENIVDGVVDDQKRVLEYGTVIRNQARQLSELIEQVLSFASTRKGAARFNLRPLQASEVIDVALESTAGIVSEAGFVVECEIEPGLPEVHADLALLSQCLQNLITNAVKYGGDSRWIGIAAQTATENGGPEVQISVEDHGLGVDPSELEHIFDAFYRSSSAADSPIHGTGLGLSLAKSFAEAMGGKLTVKSQLGRGTCFVVHLPVAGSGSSAPEVAAQMDDPKLT